MKVFYDNVGRLAVVSGGALPAVISVPGLRANGVLLTQVSCSQAANIQIQPSLARAVFIYAYGDRVGQMKISGSAFVGQFCGDGGRGSAMDGANSILQFYATNRVSATIAPLVITIGKTSFSGFLHGVDLGTSDPTTRVFQWSMSLAMLPNFDGLIDRAKQNQPESSESPSSGSSAAGSPSYGGEMTSAAAVDWKPPAASVGSGLFTSARLPL